MQIEMEVSVGDVIQIGDHTLLVVEAHQDEVTFKLCSVNDADYSRAAGRFDQPR